MAKKEATDVEIRGNRLTCPICRCDKFWERQTLMNTRGMTLLALDWANKEAYNYVCNDCGYVFWFLEKPRSLKESTSVCPKCGSSNINKAVKRMPKSQQEIVSLGFKCEWECLCSNCRHEWLEREEAL